MNDTLKALVEAADKATPGEWQTRFLHRVFKSARKDPGLLFATAPEQDWADCEFIAQARNAIPAIRASLARDAALEALIAEFRQEESCGYPDFGKCADRLTQILEGRK